MTVAQKSLFTEELDEVLSKEIQALGDLSETNVNKVESITNTLIGAYKSVGAKHSKTTKIVPPKRSRIWKDDRVKQQNQAKNRAKYEYRHQPTRSNKTAMNRESKALTKVMCKVRKELFRGDMTQITTHKDMSRLTKYAKNGKMREIGIIKDTTGNLATSPEAAIENLCVAHFPKAKELKATDEQEYIQSNHASLGTRRTKTYSWITDEIIKKALRSFQGNKAPGLDGITPNVLKLSGKIAISTLKTLFNMLVTLGYTPSQLRTSKVIFIGKADKDDYTLPKSFRPISLTPFIFKLLERVASWFIIHKTLKDNPLNERQHAYRTGKSTESAISQVLNQIEKGLLKRSYTLACFIDISSAFDRLDPKQATRALISKGVPKCIANWYENYLTMRFLDITIKERTVRKSTTIGCPQGGVLSTILWNVAFDNLLNLFKNDKVICVGYADDGSLLLSHDNLSYLYLKLNEALAKCQKWAEEFGLDISPEKTKYMLFTKKKKYRIPPSGLTLKGMKIEKVKSFKYLGMHVDDKLSWTEHISTKIESASKLIFFFFFF